MIIIAEITQSGAPATGLSPTIDIRDVSDGSLDVDDGSMTEVGSGWYKYDFSSATSTKQYVWVVDAGATLPNPERYVPGEWALLLADWLDSGRLDLILDSIGAGYDVDVSLACSVGLSGLANANAGALVNMGKTITISGSGSAQSNGAISVSKILAQAVSAQANAMGSTTVSIVLDNASSGQANAAAAFIIALYKAILAATGQIIDVDFSLSQVMAQAVSAQANAMGSATVSIVLDNASSGQANAAAAFIIALYKAISAATGQIVDVNLSLSQALSQAVSAQANSAGATSISILLQASNSAMANVLASVLVDTGQELTISATEDGVTLGVVLDPSITSLTALREFLSLTAKRTIEAK